jgi:predicted N-acetyltransferase YhbS
VEVRIQSDDFADWDGLHALLQAAFGYMEDRIDPPSSLHKLTTETLAAKAESETLLLAYMGDRLAGCCFLADQGEAMYLGKLAVSLEAQSKGVGVALVRFALNYSRSQGKSYVELQSRIELTEVHDFFQKFGFRQSSTTTHEGYDHPTSITMQLTL